MVPLLLPALEKRSIPGAGKEVLTTESKRKRRKKRGGGALGMLPYLG